MTATERVLFWIGWGLFALALWGLAQGDDPAAARRAADERFLGAVIRSRVP